VNDGGTAGLDTFRSLAGFNIIQGWQAGERIELDEATAQRNVILSGGNYFLRLDTDTIVGNGGTSTETWVLLGSTPPTSALVNQINANVFVDPTFAA
jgi:hypothetical protein